MEAVAWATHKYLMHGLLWRLHEDHHVVDKNKVLHYREQDNDFYIIRTNEVLSHNYDLYVESLNSNFADIANIGGEAGSITAACFLYQFIKEFKWAHLDVAGTACNFTGNNKQSTGRPIPSLLKYLQDQCK